MTAYELMIKTNHHLIKGGELTDAQKANIVQQLLAAKSDERTKDSFYTGLKCDKNRDSNGDIIGTYPGYYIPPYNGNKKYQTVVPMSPKTHILSSNAYELDILRLLHLFAPEHPVVKDMVRGTLKRLKTTCFGDYCSIGECFHSSLPVMRFINAAAPEEKEWIRKLIAKTSKDINSKYKTNAVNYYRLCLSELARDISEPELLKYKDELYEKLSKSVSMNTENAKIYQPVLYCVYRDCLSALQGYEYIKNRRPYISEKDGRLYFDLSRQK